MLTVRKASSMLKSHGYRHSPNGTAHFYYKGLNTIIVQQGSEFLDYGKESDKNFIVVYFKKLPDNLNKADVDSVMAKQLRFRAPSNDETIKEALDTFSYALNAGVRTDEVFDQLEDFEQWLDERERLCEHLEDQFVEYAQDALDMAESKTERKYRSVLHYNHNENRNTITRNRRIRKFETRKFDKTELKNLERDVKDSIRKLKNDIKREESIDEFSSKVDRLYDRLEGNEMLLSVIQSTIDSITDMRDPAHIENAIADFEEGIEGAARNRSTFDNEDILNRVMVNEARYRFSRHNRQAVKPNGTRH